MVGKFEWRRNQSACCVMFDTVRVVRHNVIVATKDKHSNGH